AAEFVAIAQARGEQALERMFWRGPQPARAWCALRAAGELERERRNVRLGIAGHRQHGRLHLQHVAFGKEAADRGVQRGAQAQRIETARGLPVTHAWQDRKSARRASSQTSTPSSAAFASLDPAASPATTKDRKSVVERKRGAR